MNHVVAYELLTAELTAYCRLPFQELCQLVGERTSRLVRGKDGVDYDLAVDIQWRERPQGDVRVRGFIGEANWGGPHDALDDAIVVPYAGSPSIRQDQRMDDLRTIYSADRQHG
jgi:hypothetical protein